MWITIFRARGQNVFHNNLIVLFLYFPRYFQFDVHTLLKYDECKKINIYQVVTFGMEKNICAYFGCEPIIKEIFEQRNRNNRVLINFNFI